MGQCNVFNSCQIISGILVTGSRSPHWIRNVPGKCLRRREGRGGGCHAAAEAGGRTSYASQARCRWWAYTKLATTSEIFSTRGSLNLNVVNFHRWICHLAPSRLHLDVSTNVSSSSPLTPRHASSTSAHLSSRVGHTLTGLPRISATYSS